MGNASMSSSMSVSDANYTATGTPGDQLGYCVAHVGNLDGTGYLEVFAGAPFNDSSDGFLSGAGQGLVYEIVSVPEFGQTVFIMISVMAPTVILLSCKHRRRKKN